jgi:glutaredoxin-like protein DUF836
MRFRTTVGVAPVHGGRAVEVVVVQAPACHLCDDAAEAIRDLQAYHPIDLRLVDMTSEEGRSIVARHRVPMPPVVLVDGELLGWGRLSRGRLRRALAERGA